MATITFSLAVATLLVPAEWHIDCSGWNGAAVAEFHVRITTRDGTVIKRTLELQPCTDAADARDFLWSILKRAGCEGYTVGKGILVLQGWKKASIRSIEFNSKGWKPAVRWVPIVLDKK